MMASLQLSSLQPICTNGRTHLFKTTEQRKLRRTFSQNSDRDASHPCHDGAKSWAEPQSLIVPSCRPDGRCMGIDLRMPMPTKAAKMSSVRH